jgi:hypothetical protein
MQKFVKIAREKILFLISRILVHFANQGMEKFAMVEKASTKNVNRQK